MKLHASSSYEEIRIRDPLSGVRVRLVPNATCLETALPDYLSDDKAVTQGIESHIGTTRVKAAPDARSEGGSGFRVSLRSVSPVSSVGRYDSGLTVLYY